MPTTIALFNLDSPINLTRDKYELKCNEISEDGGVNEISRKFSKIG